MLRKNQKHVFLIIVTVVALAVSLSLSSGGPKDKVKVFGKTYGQWSVDWFQCMGAIPADQNPLFSEGEVDLSIGQEGNVWYLAGSWIGPVERTGEVPADKALFFPVFNVWFYNEPGEEYTEEEMRAILTEIVGLVSVNCTVDGEALPVSSILRPKSIVQVQSPAFSFDSDLFGSADLAVLDGYWVMLPPLCEGEHVIHFEGGISEWPGWWQDVTYNITVVDEDNDD